MHGGKSPGAPNGNKNALKPARITASLEKPCMSAIRLAALILFDRQKRILLQHRTDDAPTFPGHWSFFGGGVEPGEMPEQAAKREAMEELAYRLNSPRLWRTQEFIHKGLTYKQYVFLEKYDGSDLVLGEGQGMGWFRPSETQELLMSVHARQVVHALEHLLT
jgi:8-oxo-dGTP diphosphatase